MSLALSGQAGWPMLTLAQGHSGRSQWHPPIGENDPAWLVVQAGEWQ